MERSENEKYTVQPPDTNLIPSPLLSSHFPHSCRLLPFDSRLQQSLHSPSPSPTLTFSFQRLPISWLLTILPLPSPSSPSLCFPRNFHFHLLIFNLTTFFRPVVFFSFLLRPTYSSIPEIYSTSSLSPPIQTKERDGSVSEPGFQQANDGQD